MQSDKKVDIYYFNFSCDICVIVISTHGVFHNNVQQIMFSDGHLMSLYELIYPVQKQMVNRPLLVALQACRGHFNEQHADNYQFHNISFADAPQLYHTMKDTFFFYSS